MKGAISTIWKKTRGDPEDEELTLWSFLSRAAQASGSAALDSSSFRFSSACEQKCRSAEVCCVFAIEALAARHELISPSPPSSPPSSASSHRSWISRASAFAFPFSPLRLVDRPEYRRGGTSESHPPISIRKWDKIFSDEAFRRGGSNNRPLTSSSPSPLALFDRLIALSILLTALSRSEYDSNPSERRAIYQKDLVSYCLAGQGWT